MRFLSSYKQLRLYRNKQFVLNPPDKKLIRFGIKIVILSDSRDDIYRIMNLDMFNNRFIKGFFTEKLLRYKMLIGGMKTVRQNVNEIYKEAKSKMPNISYTFMKTSQYRKRSIIYDASNKLQFLDSPSLKSRLRYIKQADVIIDSIHNDSRFNDYTKKYYIIEIDDKVKPDIKYFMRQNINSIPQLFFYRFLNFPETLTQYIGSTFILINQTGIFTYFTLTKEMLEKKPGEKISENDSSEPNDNSAADMKLTHTKVFNRLRRWLKIMYAYNIGDTNNIKDTEKDFEEDTLEDNNDKELESNITKRIDKLADKIVGTSKAVSGKEMVKSNLMDMYETNADKFNELEETTEIDYTQTSQDTEIDEIDNTQDDTKYKEDETLQDILEQQTEEELEKDAEELNEMLDAQNDLDKAEKEAQAKYDEEIKQDGEISEEPEIEEEIDTKKLLKQLQKSKNIEHTEAELKRIEKLEKNFDKLKLTEDSDTFDKVLEDFKKIQIPQKELPAKDVVNESIKHATNQDFTREYNNKMLDATIVAIMKKFETNNELKMICTSAKKDDISDNLNAMWRYTFKFEDEYGHKHTISYKIPKLMNNKFFYINGSKKMLNTQITFVPVVKIKPDTVSISTSHNIMELTRFSKAFDPKVEVICKFLKTKIPGTGKFGITLKIGDSSIANSKYKTTLEYDTFGSQFYSLVMNNGKKSISFMFNQNDIRRTIEDIGIDYVEKDNIMPIAITGDKRIIYINTETGKYTEDKKSSISDIIFNAIKQYSTFEDIDRVVKTITVPKKYMYTRMYYINRTISFGIFLGYLYGITNLLKVMKAHYEFLPERKKITDVDEKLAQNVIQFADGFLYYDVNPLKNSLIINGFGSEMNCVKYKFEELNTPIPYLETFNDLFHTKQMAKGYNVCKEFMIDPITEEVLKYMNLPTDFLEFMLYANSLLDDNTKYDPKSMKINRLRKLEIIPVMMYKSMRDSFVQYQNRQGKKNIQMVAKDDDVLKRIMASGICNDYDTLNPMREMECEGTLTWKGPGGCSVDDAYTLSRRAYDDSMAGVIACSSPDSSAVGITRYMVMNPRITNLLGFTDTSGASDKSLDYGNLGSISELATPFSLDHDDPKRVAFVTKESKHVMPANDSDPLLVCNGIEKIFPYMTSEDFIDVAQDDGVVEFVDRDLGLAIVKYKNGTSVSIDIKCREHKDGGNSLYIEAKKEFTMEVGDKFKKNDVLARNPAYFGIENGQSKPEYNPGVLCNIAIIMSFATLEDSTMITERIAKKMSTQVILPKKIVLGAKSSVSYCVKVGDEIKTGDPLMIFEDELSDDEASLIISANQGSVNGALDDDNLDIVKHTPKAKCSGVIHDIKVYYTVPYDEMSESVRKICKDHDKDILERQRIMKKYNAGNLNEIITDYVGVTKPTGFNEVIDGEICPVGKVLIEIFQKYTDYPGSGDKIVFYASMKSTIHRQIPQNLAPYPLGHPEKPIDAILSPISINARIVSSIFFAMYCNKLVKGLKEKIRGIYKKYFNSNIEEIIHEDFSMPKEGVSLENTLSILKQLVNTEDTLTSEERDKLKDSDFGLPEDRKFPLNDEAHVKSAISYFHTCEENKKPELARNILKACKKYDMEINEDAEWYSYVKK